MSQSLTSLYVHIVFSTKYRNPVLVDPFEELIHKYLYGIAKNLGCSAVAIGGHLDHVHILCRASKKIPMMDLVKTLKGNSSRWISLEFPELRQFQWQKGYAAFSVSPQNVSDVAHYIRRQKEHHQSTDFKNELRTLLSNHGVEYNEAYVWG
ncbi:IS200/IS605 family transposase [Pontibacter sp. G13]|uniref:IS200/IS605 family transposase n=1 Tax=Pontibacter sp. G13 TaxID=3074898 RepID=UPI00288A67C1|nr:IS200/IS605 family transposase [Pontibacter sp. G13]WNJ19867.1 IS200/IS605 family transposase [Pontibacter sp. G13]